MTRREFLQELRDLIEASSDEIICGDFPFFTRVKTINTERLLNNLDNRIQQLEDDPS